MTKTKQIPRVMPVPKPLTKEEQARQMAAFLAQKKEQIFCGSLFALLSNPSFFPGNDVFDAIDFAKRAAAGAIEELYNIELKEDK